MACDRLKFQIWIHVTAVCVNNLYYLQQTKDNIQSDIYNI